MCDRKDRSYWLREKQNCFFLLKANDSIGWLLFSLEAMKKKKKKKKKITDGELEEAEEEEKKSLVFCYLYEYLHDH